VGRLSSSALSTTISCLALKLHPDAAPPFALRSGLEWLAATQHEDGGWGDGVVDPSNMNSTTLGASVLRYCAASDYPEQIRKAQRWIEHSGGFAVMNDPRRASLSGPCRSLYALAGFVDWEKIRKLPTEVVLLPRRLRSTVSTTFPSFLSLSLMHERFSPAQGWRGPLRRKAVKEALDWLRRAQGPDGSYELSACVTSFVVVGLTFAKVGAEDIIRRALPFIRESQRPDGSWPVDRDLENFDSAQAVFSHHEADRPISKSQRVRDWFVGNQFRTTCFATSAPPGGWSWALPSGWPDTDDTAYALRALRILGLPPEHETIRLGIRWLHMMQNRDGSWPTFVRGSKMPFDRDCPYITAHVLSALATMGSAERLGDPVRRALSYLRRHQRPDGSLGSLWFCEHTCGTAAVVEAFADLGLEGDLVSHRAARWLVDHQNDDGGWGDGCGAASTAEETAWASGALLRLGSDGHYAEAIECGIQWLVDHQREDGGWDEAVIGLYYASLHYSNTFYALNYPLIALSRYLKREASHDG
jgi:squalene-hopene/tetraprenyl-beta-curcumene cyclase